MSLAHSIAQQLGGCKKSGDSWLCKCPLHDDNHASLSIKDGDKKDIIVKCFAGCDPMSIIRHLEETGLKPKQQKQQRQQQQNNDGFGMFFNKKIIAIYKYIDEHGALLYEKLRLEGKDFRARHVGADGKYIYNHGGHKLLYNRHLLNDIKGKQVVIVEGEKDADYVTKLGYIACSVPNGVSSWLPEWAKIFEGANVIICPDNDEKGIDLKDRIVKDLEGIAESITIVLFDGFKDVSDWGGSSEQFAERIRQESAHKETPESQEWNKNLSGDIDYIIPFDCVARDIQQWILAESIYPQPAIAYAAAMAVLSAVGGRRLRIGNIKANLMFVCMAESGEGKDFPLKCSENLIAACKVAVEGEPASGAAFFDALNNNQGHAHFSIDEFGHFLREISAKNANQYLKEVGRGFTKAYTSASSSLLGKRTKGNDPAEIKEPHITLFGLATERQVFDNVKSSDLADGSLARYSMIFGNNGLLPKNVEQDSTPPESLIKKVKEWCEAFEFSVFEKSEEMFIDEYFSAAKFKLVYDTKERTNALVNRGGEKAAFAPFYNRIAVRSVQSAMLIDKCISVDVLDWCSKLEVSGCDTFVKKCLHLSSDNDFEKQSKHLQAKIKESGKKGISHSELIKATQSIPTHARKSLLEEFIKSELIFQNNIKINGSQRPTCFYFWSKKTQ